MLANAVQPVEEVSRHVSEPVSMANSVMLGVLPINRSRPPSAIPKTVHMSKNVQTLANAMQFVVLVNKFVKMSVSMVNSAMMVALPVSKIMKLTVIHKNAHMFKYVPILVSAV